MPELDRLMDLYIAAERYVRAYRDNDQDTPPEMRQAWKSLQESVMATRETLLAAGVLS